MKITITDLGAYLNPSKMIPPNLIGRPKGELWEQMPRHDSRTFYLTCGPHEFPIYIFECDGAYEISPADVEGLMPHVYVERVEADIELIIKIKS